MIGLAIMRLRCAWVTASARQVTPDLDWVLTWDATVEGLMVILPAICVLFRTSIIKVGASRSRLVTTPFSTADELRSVIREARVDGRLAPFWVHFASRYARLVKKVV